VTDPRTIGVVLAVRGAGPRNRRCLAGIHFGPTGAKGTGEIGIAGTVAVIANAVFQATGRRIGPTPITIDQPIKAARPASGSRPLPARKDLTPGSAQQAGKRSAFRGIRIPDASSSAGSSGAHPDRVVTAHTAGREAHSHGQH